MNYRYLTIIRLSIQTRLLSAQLISYKQLSLSFGVLWEQMEVTFTNNRDIRANECNPSTSVLCVVVLPKELNLVNLS